MSSVVTSNVNGYSIALDIDDATVEGENLYSSNPELWRARRYANYEPDTIAWIDKSFAPGDVIYDIGANIGQYALYAAKSLQGHCRVLAFEPEALNYAKLNKNIVLNKLSGTVVPYCMALTERMSLNTLYVHSFVPGAAFHSFGAPVKQGDIPFSPAHMQGMVGMSLDDIISHFLLPFPNHLKIDVDGAEVFVIHGAGGTLADMRLKSVMIEIYLDEKRTAATNITEIFHTASFVLENSNVIKQKTGTAPNFIFRRNATAESNKRNSANAENGVTDLSRYNYEG